MDNRPGADASAPLLSQAERQLLREFQDLTCRLRQAGIIRSGNLVGDVGEWLMVRQYGLELEPNCRNKGFEGYVELEGQRYRAQVKVHNASIGTNIRVGDPTLYDVLFVLVGPDSTLRDIRIVEGGANAFHVYVFEPAEISTMMHRYLDGTYSCARKVLHATEPASIIPF